MRKIIIACVLGMLVLLPACSEMAPSQVSPVISPTPWIITPAAPLPPTNTPFQPQGSTFTPTRRVLSPTVVVNTKVPISTPIVRTATQIPAPSLTPSSGGLTVGLAGQIPPGLRKSLTLPAGWKVANPPQTADAVMSVYTGKDTPDSVWYYALVAPFPTVLDEVSLEEVQNAWKGIPGGSFSGRPFLLTQDTLASFETLWGPGKNLEVVDQKDILSKAWEQRPAWAIIPFEDLEPRWKVIRVDGLSSVDPAMDTARYPLKINFRFTGKTDVLAQIQQLKASGKPVVPDTNRDSTKLTTLIMTGVTALVRSTGAKMDSRGTTYPGKDIRQWLTTASLTHISNEIPFAVNCPKANPYQVGLIFCSRPEYIELLDDIGTDIVELTGNHMMDWGPEAFRFTLDLYRKRNWTIYAAGLNLEEARKAAVVEHNGNKLAFIGCNPVGPASDWAKSNSPGSANCDYTWLKGEIARLRSAGMIPIMTFQYQESYVFKPTPGQQRDFRAMAEAGAAIVSGSQSHFPQAFEFYSDGFIHYGLGNLFFDQMDDPVPGTRREFLDRHVFYQNRHISTDVLTAMLEDYSRPRPMSKEERQSLLQDIFRASGW